MASIGSAAFKAEANNPNGEALSVRVLMRDSANSLVTIADGLGSGAEGVISVSPFVRKRERRFGIVEATAVTVRFTHENLSFNPSSAGWIEPTDRSLIFKWARVEIGFPSIDEWVPIVNGKIDRSFVDADGFAELTITDSLYDLLQSKLTRDRAWTQTGWVSEIQPFAVQTSGATVTQNHGIATTLLIDDLSFEIAFTGATTFDVLHLDEPAYNQTGLSTAANNNILRIGAPIGVGDIVSLPSSIWSGTYQAGDRFRLYTSAKYSAAALNPATVLQQILLGSGGSGNIVNVTTGGSQSRVADGPVSTWSNLASRYAGTVVEGVFAKDTEVITLVQGLLAGLQATIFPKGDGRIGLYHFHPDDAGSSSSSVTGDPDDPDASILSATRLDSAGDRANRVTFDYKQFDTAVTMGKERGIPATAEAIDSSSVIAVDRSLSFSSDFEWTPSVIESAVNQALGRTKTSAAPPRFHVQGTLRELLTHDLSEFLFVTEPGLSEASTPISVVEVEVNVMENTVDVVGFSDPTVNANYARINRTKVGDSDPIY